MKIWINKILIFLRIKKALVWPLSEHELKLLENAYAKTFRPTIERLNRLAKIDGYKVKLTYKTIENKEITKEFKVTLSPDKLSGVKFTISMPDMPNVPSVKYKESYGLTNELKLTNSKVEYYIPNDSVKDFETKFPAKPQILKGRFTTIKSSRKCPDNTYYRLLIPIKEKEFIYPTDILDFGENHMKFDISNWDRQMSLLGLPFLSTKGMYSEVYIGDNTFHFYAIEQMNSFVIDSLAPISIDAFKEITDSIRLCFAFLSGKYYKEEVYFIASENSDFSTIDYYEYQVEPPSVITENQIINPTLFFQEFQRKNTKIQEKWKEFYKMFDNNIFSQMCEKILVSPEFARSLDLIVNAGNINDPVQKGALYSVSIETITELIRNENNFKPLPNEKKKIWDQLHNDLINALDKIKNEIEEKSYSILKSKIDNLNSPTNRDKLEKPFKLLGIDLTNDEINTLNNRNYYLHGGQPGNMEWVTLSNIYALQLHSLIGVLILRYFDYHGHYFNVDSWYIINDLESREILSKLDIEKIKDVFIRLENKDFKSEKEINDAKELIKKYNKFSIAAITIEEFLKII